MFGGPNFEPLTLCIFNATYYWCNILNNVYSKSLIHTYCHVEYHITYYWPEAIYQKQTIF